MIRNEGTAWLTLGQASRTLGVTPNTLRRWADRGQISSFTTPGGHRRFLVSAVQALVPVARVRRPPLRASRGRMERAYRQARPFAQPPGHGGWLSAISESERQDFRRLGMQLVGDILAGLDADGDKASALLAAAEKHAAEYGAIAARLGASLTDTVEGFLRFRKPFVDELAVLARRRHLDTREATALLVEAESTLDRLLVALMVGHAAPRSAE